MIGAIAGDMVGSPYEVHPITHKSFDIVVSNKNGVRSLILTYHFSFILICQIKRSDPCS